MGYSHNNTRTPENNHTINFKNQPKNTQMFIMLRPILMSILPYMYCCDRHRLKGVDCSTARPKHGFSKSDVIFHLWKHAEKSMIFPFSSSNISMKTGLYALACIGPKTGENLERIRALINVLCMNDELFSTTRALLE